MNTNLLGLRKNRWGKPIVAFSFLITSAHIACRKGNSSVKQTRSKVFDVSTVKQRSLLGSGAKRRSFWMPLPCNRFPIGALCPARRTTNGRMSPVFISTLDRRGTRWLHEVTKFCSRMKGFGNRVVLLCFVVRDLEYMEDVVEWRESWRSDFLKQED